MMFTGEVVDAETAKSIGLVLDAVSSEQLLDRAYALAAQVTHASATTSPQLGRRTNHGRCQRHGLFDWEGTRQDAIGLQRRYLGEVGDAPMPSRWRLLAI